jgi:hypothetical protein
MRYLQAIRNGHIAAICLKVNYFSGIYFDVRPQVFLKGRYVPMSPLAILQNCLTGHLIATIIGAIK